MTTTFKTLASGLFLCGLILAGSIQVDAKDNNQGLAKPRPISADKLKGTWSGAKDQIKVTLSFDGKEATWAVRQENPNGGAVQKEADQIELANNPLGIVGLNKVFNVTDDKGQATGKEETVRMGWLQGVDDETMKITVLPVKEYPLVEGLVLRLVKAEDR